MSNPAPAHDRGLAARLSRYFALTGDQRGRFVRAKMQAIAGTLFRLKSASFGPIYAAYQPDSSWISSAHPEFASLYARFSTKNRLNNGGDIARLWSILLNVKQVLADGVQGDFAELGVWRGNTAAILAHYAKLAAREVFLFDTFEGFDEKDLVAIDSDKPVDFANTSIEMAKSVIGDSCSVCRFVPGHFPGSITDDVRSRRFAVVSLDCDLYEPMRAGLEFFYPRLEPGGILLLHDYSSLQWNGAKQAIDEHCRSTREYLVLCPDKSGSAFLRKSRP